jgi:hypothetical protein
MASGIQPDASKKNAPSAPAAKPAAAANPVKPPAGAKPAGAPPKQPPAKPAPPPESEDDADEDDGPRRSLGSAIMKTAPAWAVSMLLHIVILLSMALIVQAPPKEEQARVITSTPGDAEEEFEEFEAELPQDQPDAPQQNVTETVVTDAAVVENVEVVTDASVVDASSVAVEFNDFSTETAASSDLLSSVSAAGGKGGALGGRSEGQRKKLVQNRGGSTATEEAVDAALKWFASHQLPDGSWTLDLKKCQGCNCESIASGAGKHKVAGPTALALLPFLGRGYTHLEGPYRPQLEAGLHALASTVVKGNGYAGEESYAQAMAAICLTEAYAMSRDERLQAPAQMALHYITASQDPIGGGWGYTFRSSGDTSVTSWCLIALKSGRMAGLAIDPATMKGVNAYLDSVQSDKGAQYGYRSPTPAMEQFTAAGLLCRMYLGWPKDKPALLRGLDLLDKKGPNDNLYYNYYGTQVMQHVEGDRWVKWNNKLRDMLLEKQSKTGHARGSWYEGFETNGQAMAKVGGRIYTTSLATLVLEAYYRNLPIYSQDTVKEEFKE